MPSKSKTLDLRRSLDIFFKLSEHNTSIYKEVIAGFTTFSAMCYIMVVNPQILSSTGMDRDSLITVTALSAIIGTLFMAFWANLPVALAAGMGSNIIFSYVVVKQVGASWQTALTMVLFTGLIFLALSLTRWREKIIDGFPKEIQLGLQCAIGVFIAFLGLKNSGLIVASESAFIRFGNMSDPAVLLTFLGLILTPALFARRVPGAFLISIATITLLGLFVPYENGTVTQLPSQIFDLPKLSSDIVLAFDFNGFFNDFFLLLPIALYFFMSDFFSTSATLIGVTRRGNLTTKEGKIPNAREAFSADAIGTVAGAMLGTSTVTSYIESITGIEAGGRTGLTGLVVAALFLLSMFLWPIITIIPPQATAPTLILVGILMLEGVSSIETGSSLEKTMVPLATLLMTACTADLMIGLSSGCFIYTVIVVTSKQWKKITPMLLVLDTALAFYMALSVQLF